MKVYEDGVEEDEGGPGMSFSLEIRDGVVLNDIIMEVVLYYLQIRNH